MEKRTRQGTVDDTNVLIAPLDGSTRMNCLFIRITTEIYRLPTIKIDIPQTQNGAYRNDKN